MGPDNECDSSKPSRRLSWRFLRRVCSQGLWLSLAVALGATAGSRAAELERVPARPGAKDSLNVSGLRCEYQQDPLGVDTPHPQLGWRLESIGPGVRQYAYQVLVARTPELLTSGHGDLWDSGKVKSRDSAHVPYRGSPLSSRLRCYWKVRVWDESGRRSKWSRPAFWEMGLLRQEDWQGRWIGSGPPQEPRPVSGFFKSTNELSQVNQPVAVDGRSALLRKTFVLKTPVAKARLYVVRLGYYEVSCNGRRIGDRVLAPAKTNYRKWVLYDTYDLTSRLGPGTNAIGIMLGNGWFNPSPKWWEPYRMQWFGSKRALVQLRVEYGDGSSEVIVSDRSWKTAPGPVLNSCVYDGEIYDAREELPNWDQAETNDADWISANVVEAPGGMLVSHLIPPIKVIEHLPAVAVKRSKPGAQVFDFGQNFAGWARLSVSGPRGTRIKLRYAEDVREDGSLDVTSNEKAEATDTYLMKGEGVEVYEPKFTFHGFRYVELTGFPGEPELTNLLGCVVHTDCAKTGSFVCGNELLNRIHRATIWSQRSNLMGYPMDCPQRDERLGWFGDAMVSMEEALFNFETPVFYGHWLNGVRLNQNGTNGDISIVSPRPYIPDEPDPTWSSAYLVMTWQYYVHYGDREFLSQQFDAMKRYVDYLGTQATNHILPKYWIGDWGTIVEGWNEGEPVSVSTAFYYDDARIVSKAARVLGRVAEAREYDALAKQIRTSFNRRFFDPHKKAYEPGTQFSNAFPLCLGLADPAEEPALLGNILQDLERRKWHFNVGVLGAKYLLEALTEHGQSEAAYTLATQTGYPSWAHLLAGGRTTLSEFWDLHGSHNHVMLGSIDGWLYRNLAGIQPDEQHPGFEHFFIKPFVSKSLSFVKASLQTVRGPIAVSWAHTNGIFELNVSVPGNSSATIHVPARSRPSVQSTPALRPERFENGRAVYNVSSGMYQFQGITE
jgi:alpha-L-rhamnosidase